MVEIRERGEDLYRRLLEMGLFTEAGHHELKLEDGKISFGEGYPITAIEKFLGYFDKQINIANFPSISFNTDFSKALTACQYLAEPGADSVILDGENDQKYMNRAGKAVNYFKSLFGIRGSFRFYMKRVRRYTEAKGLGESAAIASSTARAIVSNAFDPKALRDASFVSRLARLVSGSGTRSAVGGFSLWLSYPWIRDELCHGVSLPVDYSKFHFLTIPAVHEIRTEGAHDIAISSPFYPRWMINKFQKITELLDGGLKIEELMRHSEDDMFLMHSLLMSRGTVIHTPESLGIINSLKKFREKTPGIYFTSDTGPSLVLMSTDRKLLEEFSVSTGRQPVWGKVMSGYSEKPENGFRKEAEDYFSNL